MKNHLTPQQKKAYAYGRDHTAAAEYPHAFRRKWPRKKVRARRQYRRQVKGELEAVVVRQTEGVVEEARVESIRRKMPIKWQVLTVREWIESRGWRRAVGVARRLFRNSYSSEAHRERFIGLLNSLPRDPDAFGCELAEQFQSLLAPPVREVCLSSNDIDWHRGWLRDFLQDVPEWKPQLRAWIRHMQAVSEAKEK